MSRDLLIVGAGPAGVSAALWARSLDLEALVLERAVVGGQLHLIHFPLRNVAGSLGLTGAELAERLAAPLCPALAPRTGAEVVALDPVVPRVTLADGETLEARAVLLTSGARRRTLDAPGAARLAGHGVSHSATRDRDRFAGRDIVVVGGGDAAYENALILADAGCHVTLVIRGAPRARARFGERVAARREIMVRDRAEVAEVLGGAEVRAVRLAFAGGGGETIECAGVVVKIGMIPNSECFRGAIELDPQGFVRVDASLRTSHPHVWAAGDLVRPPASGIPVAWGQAAMAVESIRRALAGG